MYREIGGSADVDRSLATTREESTADGGERPFDILMKRVQQFIRMPNEAKAGVLQGTLDLMILFSGAHDRPAANRGNEA
jgi:hypothetical protein